MNLQLINKINNKKLKASSVKNQKPSSKGKKKELKKKKKHLFLLF